jgi:hypothetical protein
MIDPNLPTLGFKQMHPLQVEAVTVFIETALNVACMTGDEDVIREVEDAADNMVPLFGGNSVSVKINVND